MPTAQGYVKSKSGTRVIGNFIIDDFGYTFSGNVNPAVQPFESDNALLTYNSVGQLVASRSWNGQVGPDKVKLHIANGPSIEGQLEMPVSSARAVEGSVTWIHN
jgi:hypothetical protein